MEQEGPAVGHVDLVLDSRFTGQQVACVAFLAGAVASPDLDRSVLRKNSGRDPAVDEGAACSATLSTTSPEPIPGALTPKFARALLPPYSICIKSRRRAAASPTRSRSRVVGVR